MRDRETQEVNQCNVEKARDEANYKLAQDKQFTAGAMGTAQGVAFSEEGLLNHLFSYHSPYGTQTMQYQAIREAAKYFAKIVLSNTPKSADQSDAIRKIREAVMTANASIALGGVSS